jgi:3-methyl-2-oxobutanoate hydroxymethyltransferase
MAKLSQISPVTVPSLISAKGQERIAMMTAYDAPSAALLDEAGVDVLLVGDSVEMALYGESHTLSATMDSMLRHSRAVARAAKRALVVGDMPFLSYQADPTAAVRNAGRFLAEGGCAAVKVEGGRRVLAAVEAILSADIPVMGHIGLTPQSFHKFGGFKVQGRHASAAAEILEDAAALTEAGCFALVLECVPKELGAQITHTVSIPTIGIGAGPDCDGQVLVYHDVMGLNRQFRPKFVRRYVDLATPILEAARQFTRDVKDGSFPNESESFTESSAPALRRVY